MKNTSPGKKPTNRNSVPLHEQVYAALREDIVSARMAVGDKLSTEDDLCRRFHVSRITVRHALTRLRGEGLIKRAPRRGTVVISNAPAIQSGWRVDSINDIVSLGERLTLRVRSYRIETLSGADAQELRARRGFRLEGIRRLRNKTIGFTSILLPDFIGSRFVRGDFQANTVFTLLEERLGEHIAEIQERIAAQAASEPLASQLKCAPGAPVLFVERVYLDAKKRPLELARAWYLSRFSIQHQIAVPDLRRVDART